MKRFIICLLAGLSCGMYAHAQVWENLERKTVPVEIGRELPRTRTVGYPSQEAALEAGAGASRYFQPLTEWEKGSDSDGNAIYSTKYKVPFDWIERRYFLRIGSATAGYTVIVNGELAGYNQSGGSAAEFDLTGVSTEGLNRLEIIVYKDPAAGVLHSGEKSPAITGETYIVSQPRIRIRDFVAKPIFTADGGSLELGVVVKSHLLNPKTVRVYYSLVGPDGEAGPYGHRDADFEMKLEDTVRFFVNVPGMRPWSHESPNVYTLLLRLQHEGRYTENVAYRLGMRNIEIKEGAFTVNGNPVQLHVAEYGYKGDPAAAERDLRELKNSGINMIKVKGGPQPDAFYAICDRIGLYVCDQADIDTHATGMSRTKGGNPSNDPQWEHAYIDRAVTMYHTSKNHPSVVMFSIADDSSNGYNLYESYLALKALEPDRPVIYADGGGEWNTDALYTALHTKFPEGLAARVKLSDRPDPAGNMAPEIIAPNPDAGVFALRNNYGTANLRTPVVEWEVKQGRKTVSKGTFAADKSVPPGGEASFTVTYGKAKRGKPLTVGFTVFRPREAFDPAPAPTGKKKDKTEKTGMIELARQTLTIPF